MLLYSLTPPPVFPGHVPQDPDLADPSAAAEPKNPSTLQSLHGLSCSARLRFVLLRLVPGHMTGPILTLSPLCIQPNPVLPPGPSSPPRQRSTDGEKDTIPQAGFT